MVETASDVVVDVVVPVSEFGDTGEGVVLDDTSADGGVSDEDVVEGELGKDVVEGELGKDVAESELDEVAKRGLACVATFRARLGLSSISNVTNERMSPKLVTTSV